MVEERGKGEEGIAHAVLLTSTMEHMLPEQMLLWTWAVLLYMWGSTAKDLTGKELLRGTPRHAAETTASWPSRLASQKSHEDQQSLEQSEDAPD